MSEVESEIETECNLDSDNLSLLVVDVGVSHFLSTSGAAVADVMPDVVYALDGLDRLGQHV